MLDFFLANAGYKGDLKESFSLQSGPGTVASCSLDFVSESPLVTSIGSPSSDSRATKVFYSLL